MHHFFFAINSYLTKNKFRAIGWIVTLLIALFFFATQITFQEDIDQLIPNSNQSNITSKVLKQVNFADKITIVIKSKKQNNSEDLYAYANQFLDSINVHCNPYISKIQGKLEEKNIQETFDFVYTNLPLFLDKNDYQIIQNKINNDSIANIVVADYRALISPTGIVSKDYILKDPLGISFMALKKLQQLSVGDDFVFQDGYLFTKDKKNILLFITPKLAANETDHNSLFIEKLNSIKNHLNSKFNSKVEMFYFGATPVAVANATQIKADVRNTSIFASIALILILAFFYRSVLTPIIIFIPSLFGAVFALSILYFTKGTISAISLGISSILLGETTDYSIYVLTHLRNKKDIKLLYTDISKPLLLCGITTAITFLCLFFVKSEALKDLGIFAALSVIATSFFSLVLIPLLYKTTKIKLDSSAANPIQSNLIDKFGEYPYHKNKFMVLSIILLLIIAFFTYSKVTFNNDLSALNFIPKDLQRAQNDIEKIADNSSKSIYLATYGDSYEQVLDNNNLLFQQLYADKKKAQIANFSSIGGIVFSKKIQQQKISDWNLFWNANRKASLKSALIANGNKLGFKESTFSQFYQTLDYSFQAINLEKYLQVKAFFIDEFVAHKNGFYTISTLVKIPNANRDSFVNKIKNIPNIVVIDRQQMNETFLGSLKVSFERLVDYSFIAIFLILWFAFKRIELVIVSIVPVLFSWIFTSGMMGLFGLQFNIVNIIVCTLIFGIGVDYSIFMTTALQKEHTFGTKELKTYKTSILLSVATTILGIGVLVLAKHPALKSIAVIAIIGIVSALLLTFIIQPLVFNFFVTNRVKKGQPPFQFRSLIHGILSFIYYGFGGFLMSVFSMTLMVIIPLSQKIKMKGFRFIISKFMKSVLYTNPFVKKTIINTSNENFDKPAVLIANHTSFLDILAVGMLSPKIIYLVNDWVYNSPIFGPAVRKAGFYPVSNGIDGGVSHLKEKVEQGYSLVVFPEGTRSTTNHIHRFHKGAFYLAQTFNLDIIPVLIHGNSEVLPKGDFIIYDGAITVKILDRIKPDNHSFGTDSTARTKNISSFFKQQFKILRTQAEEANYFKKILINSFDYKEQFVIQAVKKDLNANLTIYNQLNAFIDSKAKILRFANDYGQLDCLLLLQESMRKVDSFIYSNSNRSIASTNYIVNTRKLLYFEEPTAIPHNNYDVLIISDFQSDFNYHPFCIVSQKIILINTNILINTITNFGFQIQSQTEHLVVLIKA